jgi:hypothetical protein
VSDLLSEVSLSGLLHLSENHGGNLLSGESALRGTDFDFDDGLTVGSGLELEGVVLHISLNFLVLELASDETFGVEDGVGRVRRCLVLCGVSDDTLTGSGEETSVGGSDTVSLVVGDDFYTSILLYTAR